MFTRKIMEVKLKVVKREVIKPASLAPHDRLQLSFSDCSSPAMYVSPVFFYKSIPGGESLENISRRLKTSLSVTLSCFYPLAGRIEGLFINCSDEGAVFTEARTDVLLSDFLSNLNNTNSLEKFLPTIAPCESPGTWPLLSVKVSFFGSGSGVSVSLSLSHKICDASSLLTFIKAWADTEKGDPGDVAPHFAGATIYPPPTDIPLLDNLFESRGKCVTNRLIFKSSKIAELKRKAASESIPVPTRVEAITSLIWRCAANSSRFNSVAPRSTMMIQAVDLRLRIPSNFLSQEAMGNLQSVFFLKKGAESEMEIGEIVAEFRKAKEGVNDMIRENLQSYNIAATTLGQKLLGVLGNFLSELKPDIDIYAMTSWCRKPFYEVDFGWGNPVWIGPASHTIYDNKVYVVLMDSKAGEDVEAWVGLPKHDMPAFLCDQDLLSYAVLNPPILI